MEQLIALYTAEDLGESIHRRLGFGAKSGKAADKAVGGVTGAASDYEARVKKAAANQPLDYLSISR